MLYSPQRSSILAEKGSAAPSHDDRIAERQASSYAPVADHVQVTEDNLSGLIKRKPSMHRPALHLAPAPDPAPDERVVDISVVGLIRRSGQPTRPDPQTAAPSPASHAIGHARKQLTVRINVDQFRRLEQIAQRTGRSYQDLQVSAIERYLTRFD